MSRKTAYVIPKVGVRALAGLAAVVGAMLIPAEPARADHDSGVQFFFGAAFPFPPIPVPVPVAVPVHGYGYGGPVFYERPHRHHGGCHHKHHNKWRRHHGRHDGWDGGYAYQGRGHGRRGDWDDDRGRGWGGRRHH